MNRAALNRPAGPATIGTVEHARLVSHLCQARRAYRLVCERGGKGGKQIERCLISTFQIAESIGFKGEFRQWSNLLRIGD